MLVSLFLRNMAQFLTILISTGVSCSLESQVNLKEEPTNLANTISLQLLLFVTLGHVFYYFISSILEVSILCSPQVKFACIICQLNRYECYWI